MAVSDEKYESLKARMRRAREASRETIMTVVETVETGSSSAAHGVIDGYFEGVEVFRIPLGFITGTFLHGCGALGLAPDHMHALGNGAYAQPLAEMGRRFGEKLRTGEPAQSAASGYRSFGAGRRGLSDAALQEIARGGV